MTSRAELETFLNEVFELDFVMQAENHEPVFSDLRFLSPEIATLRTHYARSGQAYETGATRPDRQMHHLRVFQNRDGEWLIVSHLIMQEQTRR